jgi:hypothetical protein
MNEQVDSLSCFAKTACVLGGLGATIGLFATGNCISAAIGGAVGVGAACTCGCSAARDQCLERARFTADQARPFSSLFAQPVASQPVASQPVASQPVASQPVASQPVASQPLAPQPLEASKETVEPLSMTTSV